MIKVGLFGIGLDTYWNQFEGLFERLEGYQRYIAEKLQKYKVEVIDTGIIDTPEKAHIASKNLKVNDVEVVFLFVSTYALSSTVLPFAQKVKVPIIILNLQPVAAIDYDSFNNLNDRGKMTGEWLAHCQACSLPEIANVFNRAGIWYDLVTGHLREEDTWKEVKEWVQAAKVVSIMRDNRLGVLGNYYGGMLDVYADLTKQSVVFGTHIEILEMCELKRLRDTISEKEIKVKVKEFYNTFKVNKSCLQEEIDRAARTSVALDKLVAEYNLGALAYYYEGSTGNKYENIVTSVIAGNTLLTGKNVPVAGECEVKNSQAMKIMDALGVGGSFSEFYSMDFNDDIIILGHDGPAHFAIAEGKVQLVPLPVYHGKPGNGLSIQMTVKHGDVTLLSVVEGKDEVFLLIAQGESVAGPTLQIGNTNSRYRFPIGAKGFINAWSKKGPAHHCAIGTGHQASVIKKIAAMFNIKCIQVC